MEMKDASFTTFLLVELGREKTEACLDKSQECDFVAFRLRSKRLHFATWLFLLSVLVLFISSYQVTLLDPSFADLSLQFKKNEPQYLSQKKL